MYARTRMKICPLLPSLEWNTNHVDLICILFCDSRVRVRLILRYHHKHDLDRIITIKDSLFIYFISNSKN